MLPITVMYYVYSGPDGMVGLNANSQEDSSVLFNVIGMC